MKRWNGWGDDTITHTLPDGAAAFLAERIGPGTAPRDATLAALVTQVPASRLPAQALVAQDSTTRLLHARGQSLPDWIALRSGRGIVPPDGVAFPETRDDVRTLLRYASDAGARLIPYGAGSSVAGHVNPEPGAAPVLTVSLARLGKLVDFDEESLLATFGAGVRGPDLEAQLRARGYTLGHFPQSFEHSTLGGWVVTRSSGQQSLGYGRIERLFAGGHLEAPDGSLDLPPLPASAAGPDLREVVLGSEGRLGILTDAIVRVSPLPESEAFQAIFFPDWERGRAAIRSMAQARLPLSMLRLSSAIETETMLRLAGHARLVGALESYLGLRGIADGKCLMMVGLTGRSRITSAGWKEAVGIARSHGGVATGKGLGDAWRKGRFRNPYLRNTLWERGYAIDTLETAAPWSRMPALLTGVETALRHGIDTTGERVHVFTHISHVYGDGGSLYTTYVFRLADDPDETLRRWAVLKAAASEAIVAGGGTISHQHGVGVDHRPYLAAEKGALGMDVLRATASVFDRAGIMNPGKLF